MVDLNLLHNHNSSTSYTPVNLSPPIDTDRKGRNLSQYDTHFCNV